MTTLTKEEKVQIVEQHLKSISFQEYSISIDLIQENSKTEPNATVIADLNNQVAEIAKQKTALTAELAKVNALTE